MKIRISFVLFLMFTVTGCTVAEEEAEEQTVLNSAYVGSWGNSCVQNGDGAETTTFSINSTGTCTFQIQQFSDTSCEEPEVTYNFTFTLSLGNTVTYDNLEGREWDATVSSVTLTPHTDSDVTSLISQCGASFTLGEATELLDNSNCGLGGETGLYNIIRIDTTADPNAIYIGDVCSDNSSIPCLSEELRPVSWSSQPLSKQN